jgi:hypothetical protein
MATIDTQIIRNAYMARDVSLIELPFGKFAASYLGVKDKELEWMNNLNEACNYILVMGYNRDTSLTFPTIPQV